MKNINQYERDYIIRGLKELVNTLEDERVEAVKNVDGYIDEEIERIEDTIIKVRQLEITREEE